METKLSIDGDRDAASGASGHSDGAAQVTAVGHPLDPLGLVDLLARSLTGALDYS